MTEPTSELNLPWVPQTLRIPRQDRTHFAQPRLPEACEQIDENHAALATSTVNVQGRSLAELRRWSRESVVAAARRYTHELTGAAIDETPFDRLIVAGHQPALFHPGVWAKNFALNTLAARHDGVGLNLVVDNDTFSSTSIRVPVGTRKHPAIASIAFDEPRPTQPWEEAPILDAKAFDSFAERVAGAMSAWGVEPLIASMWSGAVAQREKSGRLADALTAARLQLERSWGLTNLELPISRMCELEPFQWFAGHLLAELPRFHRIHNEALLEYRRINKVRSQAHPVPDLKQRGEWLEAPLWVWRRGDMQRGRVFVRQIGREMELSDGTTSFARFPLDQQMESCCCVEALQQLRAEGVHLRTRALTTTLFSRLCLGDLFIHGIGGAKYDEMTDHIIGRFFGIHPPHFLRLSATLYLGIAEPFDVQPADENRLQALLRDLRYHSERHLPPAAAGKLVAEKRELIAQQHAARNTGLSRSKRRTHRHENRERFRRLQQVNAALSEQTRDQQSDALAELETLRSELAANTVLTDREFPFCLYPEERIRPFLSAVQ